jgi:hypothetical protein
VLFHNISRLIPRLPPIFSPSPRRDEPLAQNPIFKRFNIPAFSRYMAG